MLACVAFGQLVRELLPRVHETGLQLLHAQVPSSQGVTASSEAFAPVVSGQSDAKHLLELRLLVAPDGDVLQIRPARVLVIVSVVLFVFHLPKLI